MDLVYFTIISWLAVAYMITHTQKEEVVRSIIIYFIFAMMTVSSFSIVSINLQLIQASEDKVKFLSLLINRNITMPLLVIVFINSFYRMTSYKRVIPIILLIILITLIELACIKLQIYTYLEWSYLTIITNSIYALIALVISKGINIIQLRSEGK